MTVTTAPKPSCVTTPGDCSKYRLMLDFLSDRFPKVTPQAWVERMNLGKVTDTGGTALPGNTPFMPGIRILYYREVTNELSVPFDERIIFSNEHMAIVDKPHFLPTIPSGPYVSECLVYRLRKKMNNSDIVPVNRLDRETAGLVMISLKPESRASYAALFSRRQVRKIYLAVAPAGDSRPGTHWNVETRIEKSHPWFLCRNTGGKPNAATKISSLALDQNRMLFRLEPLTGKQHQLRLHMCHIGHPVVNDPFYPALQEKKKEGFLEPLQLLAYAVEFTDPVTNERISACSRMALSCWNSPVEALI